jgi:cephalosporin-C deacetylase-like acetyl esterase
VRYSILSVLLIYFSSMGYSQQDYRELLKLFAYDTKLPLDVQVTQTDTDKKLGVRIKDINFVSPVSGRVTAFLVEPSEKEPSRKYAGIVFLHWGQGDRSEFVWEGRMYAKAGAISICIDAPWNRPEPWKQPGESFSNPGQSRSMYIQNIIDCRRAIDLLIQTGLVDPERIAYVGHSFGATQGGVLAGVEKRIKTFVLMGGLPSLVDKTLKGARKFDDLYALIEKHYTQDQWQAYVDRISPLTPADFISHAAPSSVLMQFGRFDSWISKAAAKKYFDAASSPKEIRWYFTGHEFTDPNALRDRARWLQDKIGIGSIIPLLQRYYR